MSKASVFAAVKAAARGVKTETGVRNAIQRALAEHGWRTLPSVERARHPDAGLVRVYLWRGSPAGDVVLISGPSIQHEIRLASDLASPGKSEFAVVAERTSLPEPARSSMQRASRTGAASAPPPKPKPKPKSKSRPKPKAPAPTAAEVRAAEAAKAVAAAPAKRPSATSSAAAKKRVDEEATKAVKAAPRDYSVAAERKLREAIAHASEKAAQARGSQSSVERERLARQGALRLGDAVVNYVRAGGGQATGKALPTDRHKITRNTIIDLLHSSDLRGEVLDVYDDLVETARRVQTASRVAADRQKANMALARQLRDLADEAERHAQSVTSDDIADERARLTAFKRQTAGDVAAATRMAKTDYQWEEVDAALDKYHDAVEAWASAIDVAAARKTTTTPSATLSDAEFIRLMGQAMQ